MQHELDSTDWGWTDFDPDWELRWVRQHGRRLRSLRKERRISQRQLADEAGVNVSQVSRVERGRDAQLSTILKLYLEKNRRIECRYAGLDGRWS